MSRLKRKYAATISQPERVIFIQFPRRDPLGVRFRAWSGGFLPPLLVQNAEVKAMQNHPNLMHFIARHSTGPYYLKNRVSI